MIRPQLAVQISACNLTNELPGFTVVVYVFYSLYSATLEDIAGSLMTGIEVTAAEQASVLVHCHLNRYNTRSPVDPFNEFGLLPLRVATRSSRRRKHRCD